MLVIFFDTSVNKTSVAA